MDTEEEKHLIAKRILDTLRADLVPFIEDALRAFFPNGADSPDIGPTLRQKVAEMGDDQPLADLDSHSCLKLIIEISKLPFFRAKDKSWVCYAHEMAIFRNRWAHEYNFSQRELDRAKDTAELLTESFESVVGSAVTEEESVANFRDPQHKDVEDPKPHAHWQRDAREAGESDWQPSRSRENHRKQEERVPDLFEPGQVLRGTVAGITNHGFLLDLNMSKNYLMHKKNLGGVHLHGKTLNKIYRVKEDIEVRVQNVDSLGRPDLAPVKLKNIDVHQDPDFNEDRTDFRGREAGGRMPPAGSGGYQFNVGDEVSGRIKGIYAHGASVELGSGWSGYLHISNISRDFVENVSDYVAIGDDIRTKVLKVDAYRRRLDLGLKQLEA